MLRVTAEHIRIHTIWVPKKPKLLPVVLLLVRKTLMKSLTTNICLGWLMFGLTWLRICTLG